MKVNIGTYSFGGIASYLGLGPTLLEKFQTIKALGFTGVELLPVDLDNDIEDIKKWLDETGLEVVSVHAEPTEEIVKKMAALGGKAVIWAGTPFCNKEEAIEVAHLLDEMAEMAEPYGIKIGYHNHTDEYFVEDGKFLFDWLIEACDPEVTLFQVDCGWCSAAGVDPVEFINKHAGKIGAIHIKENGGVIGAKQPWSRHATERPVFTKEDWLKIKEEHDKLNVPQGTGIVDWKAVKAAADAQHEDVIYVVEREASYNDPQDRVACLAEDIAWIKANL